LVAPLRCTNSAHERAGALAAREATDRDDDLARALHGGSCRFHQFLASGHDLQRALTTVAAGRL
jgi:hypothetical protein